MQTILRRFRNHPQLQNFIKLIEDKEEIRLSNAKTSGRSFFLSAAFEKIKNPFLIVLNDKEDAAYLYNDIQKILPSENIYFFPSTIRHLSYNSGLKTDKAAMMMRTETLTKIRKIKHNIIISYPQAIAENVIAQEEIKKNTIDIQNGEKIDTAFLLEMFKDFGFTKTEFVIEPGQYAIRGGIIDVFSFDANFPYRLDFFGDEIESIRIFDTETQLSTKKIEKISIINNIQTGNEYKKIPFLKFIDTNYIIFSDDFDYLLDSIKKIYKDNNNITIKNEDNFEEDIIDFTCFNEFNSAIDKFKKVHLSLDNKSKLATITLNISQQSRIQKNFQLLAKDIEAKQEKGYETFIMSESEKQLQRLQEILHSNEIEKKTDFIKLKGTIHEGFSDNDLKISAYTDHQIFDRFHKFKLKDFGANKSKEKQLLKEINELNPGDYIVHIDYGIGIFRGLTTIENNGKKQEVVRITYKDNDNLFVSIHALHKISKYKSQEAEPPRISKLGTSTWKALKKKTKKRIKDIAKDLIELYAKRLQEKGFAFSFDTYLQEALEASFIYEETPDQLKTISDVKHDMEQDIPMDRLVCGDVGFGKTEIALRAAFKAVADNKQVALLCPTTILTYQHFKTFTERLKDLPVTVDYISRMRSTKDQKQIVENLKNGTIDIIIGTHKLIGKDIKFKDLGLLIIDEEQKFGVSVKEKLKQLRVNIDTLTLTATPIPRTLQFSLMGARDLSILQTPPPNRQPIITELHTLDNELIRNAIDYEVNRGGQIFFVHNHRDSLPEMKKYINTICPDVSIKIAHGQMKGSEIEKIMTDFINNKFDVLLTTSIIENGLDIPNANTIIINNAHKFGLSDLHQLRGRVGRSARKAFCFLIAPPKTILKDIARRRLQAIENFVELGSGFNIALQDLDIRGAGDILGAQQSGYINDIGYETFKRILEEAMLELRTNEYKQVFANKQDEKDKDEMIFVNDCQIITDLLIGFPENYVSDNAERLKLYKQLDSITDDEKLETFEKQLKDRFGDLPKQAKELLNIVTLRQTAIKLGIEKIILKQGAFINYFVGDKQSAFYDSKLFIVRILNFVTQNQQICEMKEKNEKLILRFNNINSIEKALNILKKI